VVPVYAAYGVAILFTGAFVSLATLRQRRHRDEELPVAIGDGEDPAT
jgi:hypothetical protein